MKKTILCMFSGGVDSTGALWKLLSSDDYKDWHIHVHHICLINQEARAIAEEYAVDKILKKIRSDYDFREFDYTESLIDTSFLKKPLFKTFMFDTEALAFMAAQLCLGNFTIRYIATGRTLSDDDQSSSDFRINKSRSILDTCLMGYPEHLEKPTHIPIVAHLEKKEIWDMLPKEIQMLTHWCRRPSYFDDHVVPCGKCMTCKAMEKVL